MATHKETHAKQETEHGKHESKSAAGPKGGSQEKVGSGKEHDSNNFANDKDRASAAGKKGGHSGH